MGSQARMKFGVFGNPVQSACQLEELNKKFSSKILVCQSTKEGIDKAKNACGFHPMWVKHSVDPKSEHQCQFAYEVSNWNWNADSIAEEDLEE